MAIMRQKKDYKEWRALNCEPATPVQLQNLCDLNGLCLKRGSDPLPGRGTWKIFDPAGKRLCRFWDDSPIERYIARIAEWRRGE